jgi:aminoglycoside 2'-N-acetyltransferase I
MPGGLEIHFLSLSDFESRTHNAQIRVLLDAAFECDFSDGDWQNSCGGWRILGFQGGRLVAHAALVGRPMLVDGQMAEVGYVEAIAVDPEYRGRGIGLGLIAAVNQLATAHFELSMLSTDEHEFYARTGWMRFAGKSFVAKDAFTWDSQRSADEDDLLMFLTRPGESTAGPLRVVCQPRAGDAW